MDTRRELEKHTMDSTLWIREENWRSTLWTAHYGHMTPDGHGLLRRIIDRGFFCLSSEALCNDLWFGHFACHSTHQAPEGLRVAYGACI